jgi:hypothetical protein
MSQAVKTNSNTTKSALPALGSFIGTDEETNGLVTIAVTVFSSTAGTLIIKQTNDKVNYPVAISYPVTAGVRILYGQPVVKKYFHVEFQNDEAVAQDYLLVQSVLYTNYNQDSLIRYRP